MQRLTLAEGLALGRAAGARMALAHPHTLGEYAAVLCQRYRRAGLDGLECFYGPYTPRQRRRWLSLAERHGLVVTGGSDFHGKATPQIPSPASICRSATRAACAPGSGYEPAAAGMPAMRS